jgi:predicted benzoate:H+ symporter BenE
MPAPIIAAIAKQALIGVAADKLKSALKRKKKSKPKKRPAAKKKKK